MHIAMSALIAIAALCGGDDASARTRSLVVSIDVPEDRSPDWLCVITSRSCARSSECQTAELSELPLERLDGSTIYELGELDRRRRLPVEIRGALSTIAARRGLATVAASGPGEPLRRGSDAEVECNSELHEACRPRIDLRQFVATQAGSSPKPAGRILCGFRPGAEADTAAVSTGGGSQQRHLSRPSRVAFIGLTFGDPSRRTSGLKQIRFVGTTANITFEESLNASVVTFAQVLGGDYVASTASTIGSNEHVRIKLHPRCTRFVAEMPRHVQPARLVSIETRGQELLSCKPPPIASRRLEIEIPYTKNGEEKKLTVVHADEAKVEARTRTTKSEATWTEALPPASLRLGVRSLQFRWQRPIGCLAERWREATPATAKGTWTRSCPRAILADTTICTVTTRDSEQDPSHCEYQCIIDERLDTAQFPIEARFDRIRSKPTFGWLGEPRAAVNEIVYSWTDRVTYSGQELISTVSPLDRRLMLEFENPEQWKPRLGDQIDAIRILTGQASDQINLTGRERSDPLLRWVSMATPHRTCSDRVRLVVFGSRSYEEKSLEVKDGRLLLKKPFAYRSMLRIYALAGAGVIYDDYTINATASAESGFGMQLEFGYPWSLNIEVNGQLTQRFWRGIELPNRTESGIRSVLYLRADARLGAEIWLTQRWGIAAFGGVGVGTPLRFADDTKVGRASRSYPLEFVPLVFNVLPRRAWLLLGLGARLGEERVDFRTDFLDDPTPGHSYRPQVYLNLKLRGLLR